MKKLFTFTVNKEIEEKTKETQTNDKGETITIEKPSKKTVEQKVFLRKPTRALYDEAELFYGIKLSEGIKAGLLTRALLAKRFLNDGGVLSEQEKEKYLKLVARLSELQAGLESEAAKNEKEQNTQKINDSIVEIETVKSELTDLELSQSALFEQTAENRARNKVILWWILNMSYFENENEKTEPVFGEGSFEEKLSKYDEIDEKDDPFLNDVIRKLMYYVSFWYVGRARSEEDFKKLNLNDEIK
jgi:hypothetical protein